MVRSGIHPVRSISMLLAAMLGLAATRPPAAGATAPPDAPAVGAGAAAGTTALDAAGSRAAAGDLAPLRAYVAAHPADRAALRLLADFVASRGAYAEAETLYLGLLRTSPGDKLLHDQLGRLYARQDRVDEAIAQFEASLPEAAAFADLVSLHRHIGDLAAFVASYRELARTEPDDATVQFGFGAILRRIHQPAEALVYLDRAADLSRRSCAVLDEVGNAQIDLGRTADAIAAFDACLAIDPKDYPALVDEAVARIDTDPASATAQLNHAVDLRPRRPEAYVDLGYLDDAAGRHEDAVANYDRALTLDPFFRDAYVDLGYGYYTTGRLELAEETFLRGLGVSRDDGRIEYLLAETLARRGKQELAVRAYESASRSDEPDVAAAAMQALSTQP